MESSPIGSSTISLGGLLHCVLLDRFNRQESTLRIPTAQSDGREGPKRSKKKKSVKYIHRERVRERERRRERGRKREREERERERERERETLGHAGSNRVNDKSAVGELTRETWPRTVIGIPRHASRFASQQLQPWSFACSIHLYINRLIFPHHASQFTSQQLKSRSFACTCT